MIKQGGGRTVEPRRSPEVPRVKEHGCMAEPGVATPEAVELREGESFRALVRSNRLVPDESCWENLVQGIARARAEGALQLVARRGLSIQLFHMEIT
jgi:hypothetical protein